MPTSRPAKQEENPDFTYRDYMKRLEENRKYQEHLRSLKPYEHSFWRLRHELTKYKDEKQHAPADFKPTWEDHKKQIKKTQGHNPPNRYTVEHSNPTKYEETDNPPNQHEINYWRSRT